MAGKIKKGKIRELDSRIYEHLEAGQVRKAQADYRALRELIGQDEDVPYAVAQAYFSHLSSYLNKLKRQIAGLEKDKGRLEQQLSFVEEERGIKLTGITYDDIVGKVAGYFELQEGQLTGPKRSKKVVRARFIAMYLMSEFGKPKPTLKEIGAYFGDRNHSTVSHALGKVIEDTDLQKLASEILLEQTSSE